MAPREGSDGTWGAMLGHSPRLGSCGLGCPVGLLGVPKTYLEAIEVGIC